MIGTIKAVIYDKGFGFIECEQLGMDVFFHKSVCESFKRLTKGQSVEFDYVAEKRGLRATHLAPTKTSEKITPLNKFVMVKTGTPSDIRSVTGSTRIQSDWCSSPDEARASIKRQAIAMGCNVITFLEYDRKTETLDKYTGYKGTVHQYRGMALIGMRSEIVPFNEALEEKNKEIKASAMEKIRSGIESAKHAEKEVKHSDKTEIVWVLITMVVLFFLMLTGLFILVPR